MPLIDLDFNLETDPEKYATELVAGAELSEDEKRVLAGLMSKPEVQRNLKNSVALRRDAQSAMDKARNAATEAERIRDANFKWQTDNKDVIEKWMRSQGGPATVTAPSGESLTKADMLKLVQDSEKRIADIIAGQDEAYVGLIATTVELTQKYAKDFDGEALPYADLQKFAMERKLSLANAYPLFTAPKLDERRKREFDAAIKAAKAEGYQQGLSEREEQATAEPGSGDLGSVFKDQLLGKKTQQVTDDSGKAVTGEDAFVREWNRTKGFTKSAGNA